MSLFKSKIAFGSEKDIETTKRNGVLDPLDIVFTDEKQIVWIDEDGNIIYPRDEIAYTEPGIVLTFDGDPDGKSKHGEYVRIGDFVDPNAVIEVCINTTDGEVTFAADQLEVVRDASGADCIRANGEQVCFFFIEVEHPGTYVLCEEYGFVKRIVTEETVHQIDPKYIPDEVASKEYVDSALSKIPTPDVSGQIGAHENNENSHRDIRQAVSVLEMLVGDTKVSEQIQKSQEEVLNSAKNYTDSQRIAYTEITSVELLPNTVIEGFVYMDYYGASMAHYTTDNEETYDKFLNEMGVVDKDADLKVELPVIVEIDGVTTETTATYVRNSAFGERELVVGNKGLANDRFDNTGEPFIIMLDSDAIIVGTTNEGKNHSIRICTEKGYVKTIDEKFLPETVVLEDEVASKITEYNYSQGLPCIEFGKIEILPRTIVYCEDEDTATYIETDHTIVAGQKYEVIINDVVYEVVAKKETLMDTDYIYLGDIDGVALSYAASWGNSVDLGWCIHTENSGLIIALHSSVFHGGNYVSVSTQGEIVHTVDPKYIPDSFATDEEVVAAKTEAIIEAKAYTDSQRIAYSEGNPLTFDGNIEGKTIVADDEGFCLVKVCEEIYDMSTVETVTVNVAGHSHTIMASDGTIMNLDGSGKVIAFITDAPYVLSVSEATIVDGISFSTGTYVIYSEEYNVWTTKVTFKEVIHPIDPKYLPDGGVGYTEINEREMLNVTVLPEQHATDMGVNGYFPLGSAIPFEKSKKYKVIVDGIEFVYDTSWVEDGATDVTHSAGNEGIYSPVFVDDGFPWVVISSESYGMSAVGFADSAENDKSHTVAVYELTETIHPINPKFLPQGGIGYSEFTEAELVPEMTISGFEENNGAYVAQYNSVNLVSVFNTLGLEDEETYPVIVELDGIRYNTVVLYRTYEEEIDENTYDYYLGNLAFVKPDLENTGEPFAFIFTQDLNGFLCLFAGESHQIRVLSNKEVIHKIDEKYLPEQNQSQSGLLVEQATVGQTIVVKEVDAKGRPTKWEAVNFPSHDGFVKTELQSGVKTIMVNPSPDDFGWGYIKVADYIDASTIKQVVYKNGIDDGTGVYHPCDIMPENFETDETGFLTIVHGDLICAMPGADYETDFGNYLGVNESGLYVNVNDNDWYIVEIKYEETAQVIPEKYIPNTVATESNPVKQLIMTDDTGRDYKVFIKNGILTSVPVDGICLVCGSELVWNGEKYVCPKSGAGYCDNCHKKLDENYYCDACCLHTCPECGGVTQDVSDTCEDCGYCFICKNDSDSCTCKKCPECGTRLDDSGYCEDCGACSVCGQLREECTCGKTTCPLCGSELEGNAEEGEDVFCTDKENCKWGTDVYWDCPDCGLPTITDSFDGLVATCARCGYTVE